MDALFGFILLAVLGIVAWCVASEGAWGAALQFFCVLFAGLIAMNFYEVVAPVLDRMGRRVAPFADFVALLGVFCVALLVLRIVTENLAPTQIEFDPRLHELIRWPWALATGYLTMAFLLTALHTAPLPREFLGFRPEAHNFFEISAPDRQWLGFTQWVSEHVLTSGRVFDGPLAKVETSSQRVWPSFPIRYATRRTELATGGARSAPPAAPAGTIAPNQGGGSAAF
ncbi:MAG: CvpA family protein [Planctomycetaceae bacterium]